MVLPSWSAVAPHTPSPPSLGAWRGGVRAAGPLLEDCWRTMLPHLAAMPTRTRSSHSPTLDRRAATPRARSTGELGARISSYRLNPRATDHGSPVTVCVSDSLLGEEPDTRDLLDSLLMQSDVALGHPSRHTAKDKSPPCLMASLGFIPPTPVAGTVVTGQHLKCSTMWPDSVSHSSGSRSFPNSAG